MTCEIIGFEELKKRYNLSPRQEDFFGRLARRGYYFMTAPDGRFWSVLIDKGESSGVQEKTA